MKPRDLPKTGKIRSLPVSSRLIQEVYPVFNLHRLEITDPAQLPALYAAYPLCAQLDPVPWTYYRRPEFTWRYGVAYDPERQLLSWLRRPKYGYDEGVIEHLDLTNPYLTRQHCGHYLVSRNRLGAEAVQRVETHVRTRPFERQGKLRMTLSLPDTAYSPATLPLDPVPAYTYLHPHLRLLRGAAELAAFAEVRQFVWKHDFYRDTVGLSQYALLGLTRPDPGGHPRVAVCRYCPYRMGQVAVAELSPEFVAGWVVPEPDVPNWPGPRRPLDRVLGPLRRQ